MSTLEQNTEVLPTAGPWSPPEMPEPTLSGWTSMPPPATTDPEPPPEQSTRPWGLIVGGSALAAAIVGLGVFNAFGVAGLAIAGAVTAAGAPAAAIGASDFKRRLKTGRWRAARPRPGAAHAGRLGKTLSGGRAGLGRRGSAGSRRGAGRFGGLVGKAGANQGSPSTAKGRLGRMLSGGIPGRNRSGAGTRARSSGGARPGLLGRIRGKRADRGGRVARLLGTTLPTGSARQGGHRRRGLGRKRQLLAAMGLGHAPATRKQRRLAQRAMRLNRALERRRRRDERRDHQRQDRRQRRADRRQRRQARWRARRTRWTRRVRTAGHGLRRPSRWVLRRASKPFSATWRRIMRVQWVRALVNQRLSTLARMIFGALRRRLRHLLWRIPRLLGAPPPQNVAAVPLLPDLHDDERDGDAPAVARPGRTRKPAPAVVFQPPLDAPPVPTPRSRAKGNIMPSGRPLHPAWEAVVEAFRDHVGGYVMPDGGEGLADTDLFVGTAGDAFREMQAIMSGLGDRWTSDEPIQAEVSDHWQDCAGGLGEMGDGSDEVYETWRTAMAPDLERHEEPRPNEYKTNVPV